MNKKLRALFTMALAHLAPSSTFKTTSYSQCGEDLLVHAALSLIAGNGPFRYLDIGANEPFKLSNTALLYKNGGRGLLIEPNPNLAALLVRRRGNRDAVLQVGIGFSEDTESELYLMDLHVLSTFSKEEAERYVRLGHKIIKRIRVPLMDVNNILQEVGDIDFMNVDVEGLDERILHRVDWSLHRPSCVCVETITYETYGEPKKLQGIVDYMLNQDYIVFADTFINTIFIDKRKWNGKFRRI